MNLWLCLITGETDWLWSGETPTGPFFHAALCGTDTRLKEAKISAECLYLPVQNLPVPVCVGWEQEYRFSRKILSRLFIAGWRIRKDSVWGVVGTFGQKLPRYRTCRYFRHWSVKTSKKRTIGAKQRPWTLWKGCCLILLFLKLFITTARTQECIFLVLEVLVDVFMVKNLEKLLILKKKIFK